jgi:putative hydrolase of the HAD superfamily
VHHVKAVCLDLDDTLWDLGPVIGRAELAVHRWFAERYPAVVRRFTPEDVRRVRREVEAAMPGHEHDLPRLRRATFARIAREAGYDEGIAEDAFREFQRVRNALEPFADVRPALERLARRGPVVALTNGTADLAVIGLGGYFSQVFMASDVGAAKPDARAFMAVCAALGLAPGAVLHAGDHPANDVAAARAVGMPAVWIDRGLHAWPRDLSPAEHVVSHMGELADLLGA